MRIKRILLASALAIIMSLMLVMPASAATVAPTLTTGAATNMSYTTATLAGNVSVTGGANETIHGFKWGTASGHYTKDWHATGSFGTGDTTHAITGLQPMTTYYFVFYATNSAGKTTGTVSSFATLPTAAPTMTTASASNVTAASAQLNGSFTLNGQKPKAIGFEWGTATGVYTHTIQWLSAFGYGAGSYHKVVGGLDTGAVTYYYRTYAIASSPNYHITLTPTSTSGTATWSKTSVDDGKYSVKLVHTDVTGSISVYYAPQDVFYLGDLDSIAANPEWSFWYKSSAASNTNAGWGPQIELRFVAPGNTDPEGTGHVDITLMPLQHVTLDASWHKLVITKTMVSAIYYGNDPTDGTAFGYFVGGSDLAQMEGLINNEAAMKAAEPDDTCGAWTLARVKIELWDGIVQTFYIGDVTINGIRVYLDGSTSKTQKISYGTEQVFGFAS